MIIRNAVPNDAAKLVEFFNRIGGESDYLTFGKNQFVMNTNQKKQYIEVLSKAENGLYLVVEDNTTSDIIAACNYSGSSKARIKHNVSLGLFISRKYWNRQIGTKLLEIAIEQAINNKSIININLEVRSDHRYAIQLYRKFNFKQVGVLPNEMKINGIYYDTLIMTRDVRE